MRPCLERLATDDRAPSATDYSIVVGTPILGLPMPIYEYRCEKGHTFDVMQRHRRRARHRVRGLRPSGPPRVPSARPSTSRAAASTTPTTAPASASASRRRPRRARTAPTQPRRRKARLPRATAPPPRRRRPTAPSRPRTRPRARRRRPASSAATPSGAPRRSGPVSGRLCVAAILAQHRPHALTDSPQHVGVAGEAVAQHRPQDDQQGSAHVSPWARNVVHEWAFRGEGARPRPAR